MTKSHQGLSILCLFCCLFCKISTPRHETYHYIVGMIFSYYQHQHKNILSILPRYPHTDILSILPRYTPTLILSILCLFCCLFCKISTPWHGTYDYIVRMIFFYYQHQHTKILSTLPRYPHTDILSILPRYPHTLILSILCLFCCLFCKISTPRHETYEHIVGMIFYYDKHQHI